MTPVSLGSCTNFSAGRQEAEVCLFEQLKSSAKTLWWEDYDLQNLYCQLFLKPVSIWNSTTYNKELGFSYLVKIQRLYLMLWREIKTKNLQFFFFLSLWILFLAATICTKITRVFSLLHIFQLGIKVITNNKLGEGKWGVLYNSWRAASGYP